MKKMYWQPFINSAAWALCSEFCQCRGGFGLRFWISFLQLGWACFSFSACHWVLAGLCKRSSAGGVSFIQRWLCSGEIAMSNHQAVSLKMKTLSVIDFWKSGWTVTEFTRVHPHVWKSTVEGQFKPFTSPAHGALRGNPFFCASVLHSSGRCCRPELWHRHPSA